MAASDLTLQQIQDYFREKGNTVKNRELVHQFKRYLTDPASKDDARLKFKKYVNILAQTKTENGEKFLTLKSKYVSSIEPTVKSPAPHYDPRVSVGVPVSPVSHSVPADYSPSSSPSRQPPPYRPPPPVSSSPSPSFDNISLNSIMSQDVTPQAPPRRKSTGDKQRLSFDGGDGNSNNTPTRKLLVDGDTSSVQETCSSDDKQTISVKERTQKFNRLASVEDELSPRQPKSAEKSKGDRIKKGADEDDGASVTSLEPKKCMEWCVTASKGDIQELLKLAKDEPRLVNRKDPFTAYSVLHWGAKHGSAKIIKAFAGNYKVDVNGRTNGGYTPLHLAAQFGHRDIYRLLIDVYRADSKIRDYSGRMPAYYFQAKEDKGANENIRKMKGRKKQSEKDLRFLRIGSLNVRVKKTTEAFSNFLGVGSGLISPIDSMSEKVHKGWGSADNVCQDNTKSGNLQKKKAKRPYESSGLSSTPTTPKQELLGIHGAARFATTNDSDSDSAAGFDSQWKN